MRTISSACDVYCWLYVQICIVYIPSVVNLSLESVNDRARHRPAFKPANHLLLLLLLLIFECCHLASVCICAHFVLPFFSTSIFSYSFIVIIWLLAIIFQSNNQMHFIYESQTKREDNNYLIALNMLLQHFSISFEFFNVNAELAECVSLNVLSLCRSWKKWKNKMKIEY